jgi:hypothetical protein
MSIQAILLPLFVQVALTLVVGFMLAFRRTQAVRNKELRGSVALREPNWPDYARKAEYNFANQFELPVLFYVLVVLAIITRQADLLFVLLSWVFVVLRALHCFVHLTSNITKFRGLLFISGAIVLTVMWLIFMVKILLRLG